MRYSRSIKHVRRIIWTVADGIVQRSIYFMIFISCAFGVLFSPRLVLSNLVKGILKAHTDELHARNRDELQAAKLKDFS